MKRLRIACLALAALLIASAARAELALVRDGKPTSVIVLPAKWFQWQKLAAEELQYHLRKMSGATVPIVTDDQYKKLPGEATILVAQSRLLDALGIDTAALPPETCIIRTVGDTLVLAGEDGTQFDYFSRKPGRTDIGLWQCLYGIRCGSLHAVHELLDTQFGCRWLWPGETGEVIPRRATVAVPDDLNITKAPPLMQRNFRSVMRERTYEKKFSRWLPRFPELDKAFQKAADDEDLWLLRQHMGRNYYFPYGHAFTAWWKRYGKDHPEIFALNEDGTRGPGKRGKPEVVKMCVSSPELHDMLIEQFKATLAKQPNLKVKALSICENDGDKGFCTCERCRAWDIVEGAGQPRMEKGHLILSERYARFYNVMARRVREVDPDAFVIAYAYSWYQPPPVNVVMEPNILIALTEFSVYPKRGNGAARWTWLEKWSRGGSKVLLRPNSLWYFPTGVPYAVHTEMGNDLKAMVEQKRIVGTDFDYLSGLWATAGPVYYVLARIQWQPEATLAQLLDEYYAGFGPMGPAVREYFDYWEAFVNAHYGDTPAYAALREEFGQKGHHWQSAIAFCTPEVRAKARAILQKAAPLLERAAPEERERFQNIELGLRHVDLTLAAYALPKAPEAGTPEFAAKLEAARALMDFRREIVGRDVINVYAVTDAEIGARVNLVMSLKAPAPKAGKAGAPDPLKALDMQP